MNSTNVVYGPRPASPIVRQPRRFHWEHLFESIVARRLAVAGLARPLNCRGQQAFGCEAVGATADGQDALVELHSAAEPTGLEIVVFAAGLQIPAARMSTGDEQILALP